MFSLFQLGNGDRLQLFQRRGKGWRVMRLSIHGRKTRDRLGHDGMQWPNAVRFMDLSCLSRISIGFPNDDCEITLESHDYQAIDRLSRWWSWFILLSVDGAILENSLFVLPRQAALKMSSKHENHTMACTRVLLGAGFINTAHFSTADEAVQVTGDVQTNLAQPDFNVTFYTIRIWCPLTKSLWTIRLRFSQAYATRKVLLEMVDACPLPLQTDILALCKSFPRRRLGLDNEMVIAERAEGLKNYVMALMQVRELCGHHTDPAVVALKAQVDEILNLPVIYKMDTFNKSTDQLVDGMCSICLDDMQDNDACVRLRCDHAFHMPCVSAWLSRDVSCPLCREQA
ncbi:hypothetical protein AC1031_014285 [Aphanomyces cochlioides]|nr:hypothetical protein AC1031_014285 [Aphanomyces cochlioides]